MNQLIKELVIVITKGDETNDITNILMFAEAIEAQQNIKLKQETEILKILKVDYFNYMADGMNTQQATTSLTSKIYKLGMIFIQVNYFIEKKLEAASIL